jgi:hypothetical protein
MFVIYFLFLLKMYKKTRFATEIAHFGKIPEKNFEIKNFISKLNGLFRIILYLMKRNKNFEKEKK